MVQCPSITFTFFFIFIFLNAIKVKNLYQTKKKVKCWMVFPPPTHASLLAAWPPKHVQGTREVGSSPFRMGLSIVSSFASQDEGGEKEEESRTFVDKDRRKGKKEKTAAPRFAPCSSTS
jgi:hypothetical protein